MPILTRLSDTWACAASEPANTARPAVTYRAKGIMVSSWATWSDRQGIGHEPAGFLPEGALSRPRPHRTPRRQAQALQAHCAPLRENEQELRILRRIRSGPHHRQIRPHGLGNVVFSVDSVTPFQGYSKAKAKLDQKSGVRDWTLHDLRWTVVSGMARLGIAPHVADKILNHQSGTISGVAAVYQRHDFFKERSDAQAIWGAHVIGLAAGF